MKLIPVLTLSSLCASFYTSGALAVDTSASAVADASLSGALSAEDDESGAAGEPMADSDSPSDAYEGEGDRRDAKNAIYLDLLGPGLIYSINYDRMLTGDLAARIGLSYLSMGASAESSSGTTASAEFSYLAVPLTVSYLGIGSDTNMLELGGGAVIMNVTGSGIIEADDAGASADASVTLFAATGMLGYRRQPADGGFVFRVGASPLMTFGAGFLPWGYLSLGAAF
jgi:hypothetical protein